MFDPQITIYNHIIKGVPQNKVQYIKKLLFDYIKNAISLDEAKVNCCSSIGTSEPIDKMECLMNVPEVAPPTSQFILDRISNNKTKIWTQLEDQRLLAAIHKYGLNDWTRVSFFVGNGRNRCQCSQRWQRSLNPLINKNSWTNNEDLTLFNAVMRFGLHSWTKVSALLPGRTDVQCRYRYQMISKKYPQEYNLYLYNNFLKLQANMNSSDNNEREIYIDNSKIETNEEKKIEIEENEKHIPSIFENLNLFELIDEISAEAGSLF